MGTVLQDIVEKKHYRFVDEEMTWQEGVRQSCLSLVEDGSVDADYYKQIVACVEKYGPYVVFDHYVAMPHSQENAEGVHKTAIGFMVNKQIVDFGEDDGEKKVAKLFFTLAACDPDEHMNNIEQLMQIFMNEPLLDALMEAETPEDILKAEADHPFEDDFY